MKTCKKCCVSKPLEEFYPNPGGKDGRRPECKACNNAQRKLWYKANREREIERVRAWQRANREHYLRKQAEYRAATSRDHRSGHLKRKFGLTLDEYEQLLRGQGGRCAVCGAKPEKASLHVDHDHVTGEIRGLLCFRCNGGLGQFKEKPLACSVPPSTSPVTRHHFARRGRSHVRRANGRVGCGCRLRARVGSLGDGRAAASLVRSRSRPGAVVRRLPAPGRAPRRSGR